MSGDYGLGIGRAYVDKDRWLDHKINTIQKYIEAQQAANYESGSQMIAALNIRLRADTNKLFDRIVACKSQEKAFVFIVKDGKAAVLEDEWTLYPSDRLITQIRMIANT